MIYIFQFIESRFYSKLYDYQVKNALGRNKTESSINKKSTLSQLKDFLIINVMNVHQDEFNKPSI